MKMNAFGIMQVQLKNSRKSGVLKIIMYMWGPHYDLIHWLRCIELH